MFRVRCWSGRRSPAPPLGPSASEIAVFWVYLAILAAIFVASILLLDPDLARERGAAGRQKTAAGAAVVFRRPRAALDHRRARPRPRCVPLWLQILGLVALAGSYAFCIWAMQVDRFFSSVVRVQSDHSRTWARNLRGHSPPGPASGHRRHAGQRRRARVLDRDRILCHPDAAVPFLRRDHGGSIAKRSFRAMRLHQRVRWRLIPGLW